MHGKNSFSSLRPQRAKVFKLLDYSYYYVKLLWIVYFPFLFLHCTYTDTKDRLDCGKSSEIL